MFEGCTIKYGYDLSGLKNQITIEYPEKEDGSKDIVCCPINNPNNRYYKMVLLWVEEGGVIIDE